MSLEFSPIQYGESRLVKLSFEAQQAIDKQLTSDDIDKAHVKLGVGLETSIGEKEGQTVCNCGIDLRWTIKVEEAEQHPDIEIECKIEAIATCPTSVGDKDAVSDALLVNGITFVWGKIRDVVEAVSRYSPIGALTLPAVNPRSFLTKEENSVEPVHKDPEGI